MTIKKQVGDFEEAYEETEILYDNGEYKKANVPSLRAVNAAVELLVMALGKRGWTARYIGYKNPEERNAAYKTAKSCTEEILRMSKDIKARNSAIKLLILLPDQDVELLCNMGIRELDGSDLDYQEKENLKAELRNSLGIEIRKTNSVKAFHMFDEAFKTVEKGTTIAGHLKHNIATCFLILKNETVHEKKKMSYARDAIKYLEEALDNYPIDQKGHRKAVEDKIKNTRSEIKNNFQ